MDQYEVEQLVGSLTRSIEELTYRIYTMEDSIAQVNAVVEELKEDNKGEKVEKANKKPKAKKAIKEEVAEVS